MVQAGYSPSVRLFEAAACGTPIISDYWEGLDTIFELGKEILIAESPSDILRYLRDMAEAERLAIGDRARIRVLEQHTAAHRAAELEHYAIALLS
jgi:spore maturation protein CgeB